MKVNFRLGLLLVLWALLTACGSSPVRDSAPRGDRDVSHIPDAQPHAEPRSRYGNPPHYEVFGKRYYTLTSSEGYEERGIASWYGKKFHGRKTSNGDTYDMYGMTAAHTTLPLPTYVEVTNLENGRRVVLRVNDRGPFHGNRLIDLSYAAAKKLGVVSAGTARVNVRAVSVGSVRKQSRSVVEHNSVPVAPAATQLDNQLVFLQVGAYASEQSAIEVKTAVQNLTGNPVSIKSIQRQGRTLYRVRVGPLVSAEQGRELSLQLDQQGYDSQIVSE